MQQIDEVYFIGSKAFFHVLPIANFADRNQLMFLLEADGEHVLEIEAAEFNQIFEKSISRN